MHPRHQALDTTTRTIILHVVAIAGLACGALTGVAVAREAAETLARRSAPAAAAPDLGSQDGEAATCVLPGMRKPGDAGCDA